MAMLRVRYRSGDTDEWTLHDRMDLRQLASLMHRGLVDKIVSFGAAAEKETTPADFAMVGLRMSEVVSWHIDGMLEEAALIGPWSEDQSFEAES